MIITVIYCFVIIVITNICFDNALTEILQFRRALVHSSIAINWQPINFSTCIFTSTFMTITTYQLLKNVKTKNGRQENLDL
jgi:hypothetical protein